MSKKPSKKPETPTVGTNPTGRPRAKPFTDWPIFDTLSQCAEKSGWPASLLSQLKRDGAPGFRHGRVYFGEVLQWVGGRGLEDPTINWSECYKEAMTKLARIKLLKEEGEICSFAEVRQQSADAVSFFFAELERTERELAPALEGLQATQIYAALIKRNAEIRARSRVKFEAIGEAK